MKHEQTLPGTDYRRPELSIIVPAHNEEDNLRELLTRLSTVLHQTHLSWEIIVVDDGSSDNTWGEILALRSEDPRVKGVRLSRSFGHQYALFAGLSHAVGDATISMDADLQHPPEVIPEMIEQWQKGAKIVNTVRMDSADVSIGKRLLSRLFYRFFSFLSGVELKQGMADFRLLDRQVVRDILRFREEGLFLRGVVQWVGYPTGTVTFQAAERFSGISKYTWRRMFKFAWHGISSFSIVPLRIGILIGLAASLVSFYLLGDALYARLYLGTAITGWTSLMGTMTLLFGILFIFLSLLGEYIGRILVQVRHRPLFIVAERTGTEQVDGTTMQLFDNGDRRQEAIPDREPYISI